MRVISRATASTTSLNASDLDITMKLAGAVKNLCKIEKMMDEDDGYSTRMVYGRDPMGRDVEPGRGTSYGGSSYARGRRNAPRDAMGRFSGAGEGMRGYSGDGYSMHQDPARDLRELIPHAPDEQTRRMMEEIARKMER